MSIDTYIATAKLRDDVTRAGLDLDVLELGLFALGTIGDEDFGLASHMANEVLDEVGRRVAAAMAARAPLSLVKGQSSTSGGESC